jgi:hypothetical protein
MVGKLRGRHRLQAQRACLVDERCGVGVVAGHHHIAAQQLARVALQAALAGGRQKSPRR